jgi:ABC transport system ATP-binding/permease protein
VVPFDKFNPNVGTPDGIPAMGETMVSRWAFEACMVTQFKDNPFESRLYKLNQRISSAEYKKTYYIAELETELSNITNNPGRWNDKNVNNPVKKSLDLLRNEISHELIEIGPDYFPEVEFLHIGKFDSRIKDSTENFLEALKKYYILRSTKATKERDALVNSLTDTPEKFAAYDMLRMRYKNEEVTRFVENRNSLLKIVKWEGRLVQKIDPIYFDDHRPHNPLDFTANFYNPTKHFLGRKYDTLYFNIAIIWTFSILFYAALYFEVMKRIVNGFELRRKYFWKNRE